MTPEINVNIEVGDVSRRNRRHFPARTAMVCNDRRLTWREVDEQANALAHGFADLGARKGDRIAIIAANCAEWMPIYFGSAKGGTVFCPIIARFTDDEMSYILDLIEPTVVIVDPQHEAVRDRLQDRLACRPQWVTLAGAAHDGFRAYTDIISTMSVEPPQVPIDDDDLCVIMFTGGTTDMPKGLLFTHKAEYIGNFASRALNWGFQRNAVCLSGGPLYHNGALQKAMLPACYVAGTFITLPKFEPKEMMSVIQRERVTDMVLVASPLLMLLQYPDIAKYDTSSVKRISVGGGNIPENKLDQVLALFPNAEISYTLGGAEGLGTFLTVRERLARFGTTPAAKLGSVGFPAFGVEYKIIDDDGHEVKAGEVGELMTRDVGAAVGYWRRPDLAEQFMKDGWIRRGDLVRVDEEGVLWFVDRKKDMIKSGGENIYSPEIEAVLRMHPALNEAIVIGIPDEKWGEAVTAVVQLKPNHSATEQDIIAYCRDQLPGYRCPKSIKIVAEYPRSAVGKILKRDLRKLYVSDNA